MLSKRHFAFCPNVRFAWFVMPLIMLLGQIGIFGFETDTGDAEGVQVSSAISSCDARY